MMPSRTTADSEKMSTSTESFEHSPMSIKSSSDTFKEVERLQRLIQSFSSQSKLSEEESKLKEHAIIDLARFYKDHSIPNEYSSLLLSLTNKTQNNLSKAKTAKLVRLLMDEFDGADSLQLQIHTCKLLLDWCVEERRDILKRSLEAISIRRFLAAGSFTEALGLISSLSKELKKLDDKAGLMEVQLLESQTWFYLKNIPKAKASLTSARASANSIYCPPMLQASLDMQSGILHAEEKDFRTAYSYFFEAFDAYFNMSHFGAINALKYMILSKIMLSNLDEIQPILAGKSAMKYSGPAIDALKQVAAAYKNRSLSEFDRALRVNQQDLLEDQIVKSHLTDLYETLLEQNILRVIEPYTVVEVSHIASVIGLEQAVVEKKISQMILDKLLFGVIDQGSGNLELYEAESRLVTFENILTTIQQADLVLDALFEKSKRIV